MLHATTEEKQDAFNFVFLSSYSYLLTAPPVEFITELKPVTTTEKHKVELTCEISDETAEVVWLKNMTPIKSEGRFKITSRGQKRTLVISSAELDDESDYTVEVRDKTSTAKLTVEGKNNPCT